ncbi:MAG: FliH/SctL family protein [Terriglobales bacterium]
MKNSSSERGHGVETFVYRDHRAHPLPPEGVPAPPPPGIAEEEVRAREARARRQARQEAAQDLTAGWEGRLEQEHAAVMGALQEFAVQREQYFLRLEQEVVQMVLGIARKVLHREAQMDPLLLAASARVALDQLAAGTAVELIVPPSARAHWEEMLDQHPPLTPPRLRTDATLEPAGCRLETSLGATDLSVETQFKEIETGFADLLQRRTALVRVAAAAAGAAAGA